MAIPGFSLSGGAGGLALDGGDSGDISTSFGGAGIAGDFFFQRKPKVMDQLPLYGLMAVTVLAGVWLYTKGV
ncbi:hypothetical protein [Paremcibacter congregatus]|uniref:hypothetical protein n=1 Tax=Paremcibacter congregatus TaxID=2043170 RepID=UPI0030EE8F5B|tara:strand:- start:21417 stop:21632 length:216 start_codon:yes stop_codon:yes gene_type:complete